MAELAERDTLRFQRKKPVNGRREFNKYQPEGMTIIAVLNIDFGEFSVNDLAIVESH